MATAQSSAQSILDYNRGRDPEILRRKYQLLRADPYAFYRGTCHLFYQSLPRHAVLATAPALLVCGDLHLENFGVYKGDNRLAYFDLSDFDEATLAPFTLDLLRFVSSIHVAARDLRLSTRQAEELGELFIDCYRNWILDGKARWLERSTAEGMVRDLLGSVIERTRLQLLKARTVRTDRGRRLRLNERALPIEKAQRAELKAFIERFGAAQGEQRFYRLLDAARRVAGKGSLGLERYVLLVEGKGSPRGNYLLDLKRAVPSTLPVIGGRHVLPMDDPGAARGHDAAARPGHFTGAAACGDDRREAVRAQGTAADDRPPGSRAMGRPDRTAGIDGRQHGGGDGVGAPAHLLPVWRLHARGPSALRRASEVAACPARAGRALQRTVAGAVVGLQQGVRRGWHHPRIVGVRRERRRVPIQRPVSRGRDVRYSVNSP